MQEIQIGAAVLAFVMIMVMISWFGRLVADFLPQKLLDICVWMADKTHPFPVYFVLGMSTALGVILLVWLIGLLAIIIGNWAGIQITVHR